MTSSQLEPMVRLKRRVVSHDYGPETIKPPNTRGIDHYLGQDFDVGDGIFSRWWFEELLWLLWVSGHVKYNITELLVLLETREGSSSVDHPKDHTT